MGKNRQRFHSFKNNRTCQELGIDVIVFIIINLLLKY